MPRATKLQTSFNAGELSPFVEARPDVGKYYNGCRRMENVLLLPEGGFTTKGIATKFLDSTKSDQVAVLIPMEPTDTDSYMIEFTHLLARFWKNGSLILAPTGGELILNGTFTSDLANWTDADTGTGVSQWETGTMALFVTGGGVAARRQSITTTASVNYTLAFTVAGDLMTLRIGTSAGGQEILANTTYPPGNNTVIFTATTTTTWIEFRVGLPVSSFATVDNVSVMQVAGTPYELVTPYTEDDLEELGRRAGIATSVDVMYIAHSLHAPRTLTRISENNWELDTHDIDPTPSVEADTDISGGSITLTPAAVTGTGINFTASAPTFLKGDENRLIVYGTARAFITSFTSTTVVVADILDDFPNTSAIPAGQWFLRGSPGGSNLDITRRGPVGAHMRITMNNPTFRTEDLGKFIKVWDGVLQIIKFISTTVAQVEIKSRLLGVEIPSDGNFPAAPPGSWTLEVAAWSDTLGWPALAEFHEGRLVYGANDHQPTTIWPSVVNDFNNFAIGTLSTDAVQYTHASGRFAKTRWLLSSDSLFFANSLAHHALKAPGIDTPLGGDVFPKIVNHFAIGSAHVKPEPIDSAFQFIDKSRRKVFESRYTFESEKNDAINLMRLARHLTLDYPLKETAIATVSEPIPISFYIREDGSLLCLMVNANDEVVGWTVRTFDGECEYVASMTHPDGDRDQLWLVVKRTINSVVKRYVEVVEDAGHTAAQSKWREFNTDCAVLITKADTTAQTVFSGLDHLEGELVDVLLYRTDQGTPQAPRYMGQYTVSSGDITLTESITYTCKLEVGLPITVRVDTFRPSIQEQMVEGHLRKWDRLYLRFYKSVPPIVNNEDMLLVRGVDNFDQGPSLRTGDIAVEATSGWEWDLDGSIRIRRWKPYPLTVLSLFGQVTFSDDMGMVPNNDAVE